MGQCPLLRTAFPQAWLLSDAGDEDSDQENEEFSSSSNPAYQEMLEFLRLGCAGTAVQSYPNIPLVVWTTPPEVSCCQGYRGRLKLTPLCI